MREPIKGSSIASPRLGPGQRCLKRCIPLGGEKDEATWRNRSGTDHCAGDTAVVRLPFILEPCLLLVGRKWLLWPKSKKEQ